MNAAACSSVVSMDDIATSATRIRTDLGLTGQAADDGLESFLRYERATGQGADAADAASALDGTLTSKVKLRVNRALSLLRGFGMQVGPVLTGAVCPP